MNDIPSAPSRSFHLTVAPAEALAYLRRRLPDVSATEAVVRIYRPIATGFYLIPGGRPTRSLYESVPAVRVTLTPWGGDGSRVEVAWAGTVEIWLLAYVFILTLLGVQALMGGGWFLAVWLGVVVLALGARAYGRRVDERERDTHFTLLVHSLDMALRPLLRADVPLAATTEATPTAIRPLRQPGTVEVTLAGLVGALTEAPPGQEPPAHLLQLDPDAAALALNVGNALLVLLRHDPARATGEQLDARLAAVLRGERPEVLAGLSTGPVLAAILGDVGAAAVAAAPTFSRSLERPVRWCVVATDGLVERTAEPAPDVIRQAAMAARRSAAPDPEVLAALERRGEDHVGAAGAEQLFGQATEHLRRTPATLLLAAALVVIFALQSAWILRPPGAADLLRMGGMEAHGEWWRVLASGLVHAHGKHFFGNLSVMFVCYFTELAIGSSRYLVLFTASVVASSLLAAAMSPVGTVIVGASGGIFGLAAALLVLTWREPRLLPGRHRTQLRRAFLWLLGLNLLLSLSPGVSLAGHLGGALMGAVLAGSGALTWGQPRAWMDERPNPGVTWLVRGLAGACVLASALSLALAWSHGRPWT